MRDISSLPTWDAWEESLPSQARSQSSWPEHVAIPESFVCPLGKRLMKDPVIDREGNSYEREAILSYLRQPGEGEMISPVTKNPLRESDLVDNKALVAAFEAIDGSLKSALEKKSQSRPISRRGFRRIANPLSSSVKAVVRKVSTSLGNDAANLQNDLKIDLEGKLKSGPKYEAARRGIPPRVPPREVSDLLVSVCTEMSALTEPTLEEIDEIQHVDAPAQEISIGVASCTIFSADEELKFRPRRAEDRGLKMTSIGSIEKYSVGSNAESPHSPSPTAEDRAHKIASNASTEKHALGTNEKRAHRQTFVSEHSETTTAVGKFEERPRKKLSKDPAARAEKNQMRKKLLSEDQAARGSKDEASSEREAGGNSEKRVVTSFIPEQTYATIAAPKKEEVSLGGTIDSVEKRAKDSGSKDASGEDVDYACLQERRKEWSRKRSTYVQKRKASLAKSLNLKQATNKVAPSESAAENPPTTSATAPPKPATGNESATDKLAKFEGKLRKKLLEDSLVRARSGRTSRLLQSKESQEASASFVARSRASDDGTDKMLTFEDKLRKKLSEASSARARYEQKSRRRELPQSNESQGAGAGSAILSRNPDNSPQCRAVPEDGRPRRRDRRGKANRKGNRRPRSKAKRSVLGVDRRLREVNCRKISFEMSELTFEEDYSPRQPGFIPGKASAEDQGRGCPEGPETAGSRAPSVSWDDLRAEVARAEFLSMWATSADAAKLQADVEAQIRAEVKELGPCLSGGRPGGAGGGGGRRGRRAEGAPGASTPGPDTTFSGKVRSLMEVVEGSGKTRIDVMRALKEAKGDIGVAAAILLQ